MKVLDDFLMEGTPVKTFYRKLMCAVFSAKRIETNALTPYIGPASLNVGCGMSKIPGTFSLDNESQYKCNPDFKGDANKIDEVVAQRNWDCILALHLVEHLNDPSDFYWRVWKMLTPGGYFCMVVPNFETMKSIGYYRDKSHRHEMYPGRVWAEFRNDARWEVVQFNKLAFRYPFSFDLVARKK